MSAIDDFRKSLGELGITWGVMQFGLEGHTATYESNGINWVVIENQSGSMLNLTNYKEELSVEQVIRATIGEEPTIACDDEDNGLLPCPFCGGESLTISVDGGIAPDYLDFDTQAKIWAENKYVTTCTVTCDSCGATMQGYEARKDNSSDITDAAKADCFKKWNRRSGK